MLSKNDRRLIEKFIGLGVLLEVDGHKIDESKGAILVTCADGDQFEDLFTHHANICKQQRCSDHARIHVLSLNGGAKLIAKSSPLHTAGEDRVILNHISGAKALKDINTVVLYAHAPCGAAYSKGISFENVLRLLFEGKDRVKESDKGLHVACFCHVDYGNGKKRTYFASREAWLKYCSM